jgi:hypothetical protein
VLHFVLHSVSKWCNMSRYSHMCSDNQKAGNPHKQGVSGECSKYAGLREMRLYGFESRLALFIGAVFTALFLFRVAFRVA